MQDRKEGIVDYLYKHLNEKFTSKGAGIPAISWAGCEAAFKWLQKKYGVSTSESNLWLVVRERVGFAWTAVNPNKNGGQGRWHKRFANYARHTMGLEIDEEALAAIVAPYRVDHREQDFDFAPITWEAGDFADTHSCYWGSYSEARKWMVSNKFLGCRVYDPKGKGEGRCLIVPTNEGEIGIFNSYGMRLIDFGTLIQNFLVEQEVAKEVRLVPVLLDIRNDGSNAGLYLNEEKQGYLLTTRAAPTPGQWLKVDFGYRPKECSRCGKEYRGGSNWKTNSKAEWALCPECVSEGYACVYCGDVVVKAEKSIIDGAPKMIHAKCLEDTVTCTKCGGKTTAPIDCKIGGKQETLCKRCHASVELWRCGECGVYTDKATLTREGTFCQNCAPSTKVSECEVCHALSITTRKRADGVNACNHCSWYCEATMPGGQMHKEYYSTKTTPRAQGFYEFTCPTCREAGRNRF